MARSLKLVASPRYKNCTLMAVENAGVCHRREEPERLNQDTFFMRNGLEAC